MRLGITRIKLATGWSWVNIYNYTVWTMGHKKKRPRDLVLDSSRGLKYPARVEYKGTFGSPVEESKERSCGVLVVCTGMYIGLPEPGTVYKCT